jgi:hypothetical protein
VPPVRSAGTRAISRILHRAVPYLDRRHEPPAWTAGAEGSELRAWAEASGVDVRVEWRPSPASLGQAPEYGPGWLATVTPRAGGRSVRRIGPTQLDAVKAARAAYEAGAS